MKQSALQPSNRVSPLEQAQLIKQGGQSQRKMRHELAIALPLTSLIDAFSIIVIYLLIGTQSGGVEQNLPKNLALPSAQAGQIIDQPDTLTVRIEQGQYYINNQQVAQAALGARLADMKKSMQKDDGEILIQADQKMNYADLDPLIRAGSEAGIQKLKFAVLPNK